MNVSYTESGNGAFTTWIKFDNNRAEESSNRGNVIALEVVILLFLSN